MSSGLAYAYNDEGKVTHVMCCICFELAPVADLYVAPEDGLPWDVCAPATGRDCAERAGMFGPTP